MSRPEGYDLTPDEWREVGRRFLKKIDAEGNQFVLFEHTGTPHNHIHAIFSRAKPSGKLTSTSQSFYRWRAAVREVEKELGLEVDSTPTEAHTTTSDRMVSAQRRAVRTGSIDPFISPDVIFEALSCSTTPDQFAAELANRGIEIQPSKNKKTGDVTGILFRRKGAEEFLAGSSISRDFSLPKIQERIEFNRLNFVKKQEQARLVVQPQRRQFIDTNTHPRERG